MFCEKCGKKVSYKKAQCDYCKHPVVYEEFSKFEYEKVATPTPAVRPVAAPTAGPTPAAPAPAKKNTALIAIVSSAAALVLVVGITCIAILLSNSKTGGGGAVELKSEKPDIQTADKQEEYDVEIAADAELSVTFEGEPCEDYEYEVKLVKILEEHKTDEEDSKQESEETEGENDKNPPKNPDDEATDDIFDADEAKIPKLSTADVDGEVATTSLTDSKKSYKGKSPDTKLCEEDELQVGGVYEITVKITTDKDEEKEDTKKFLVIESDEEKHKELTFKFSYTPAEREELVKTEYEAFMKSEYPDGEFKMFDFEADEILECIIKQGDEYFIYGMVDGEIEKLTKEKIKADEVFQCEGNNCLWYKVAGESEDKDKYYTVKKDGDSVVISEGKKKDFDKSETEKMNFKPIDKKD